MAYGKGYTKVVKKRAPARKRMNRKTTAMKKKPNKAKK